MSSEWPVPSAQHFRVVYGKLYAALLSQFGSRYMAEMEDAIQNSMLKFLQLGRQHKIPENSENWLYIVARNDLLSQLKKQQVYNYAVSEFAGEHFSGTGTFDLRLQTIIFLSALKNISGQVKLFFILKNIFGLSVAEISSATLIGQEAIYKSINRAKKAIQLAYRGTEIELSQLEATEPTVLLVEEVLYSVFNIGFDSFSEKTKDIVNEDLCLEAMALAKLLLKQYKYLSTSNLLALFCFHAARIKAKVQDGKFVSFFHQNRQKWSPDLLTLAFSYLRKPEKLNRVYIEALIVSKYMASSQLTQANWMEIVGLYELLQKIAPSPIIQLNYCFCLGQTGRTEEALKVLADIERKLPEAYIYFSLLKANLLKAIDPTESEELYRTALKKINQQIRKDYLLENELLLF
ncbi:DUF6596 domain-containing protein [Flavihumibacter sp. CACIAM 22H1]|uniref:DUF6596 domain-containing protein n=1 Tax=Flavihumibacter sp. CACIAM 22H1 TaxID=1812911 RepID=UPI0007A90B69|nr:DUF6596 domain-containing protein [Flavihumibacter sp. CACIAM 22H1]KYP15325.1 MAG: RNA polymerase [Flavihumibacter sp. CACIAM 22H1]